LKRIPLLLVGFIALQIVSIFCFGNGAFSDEGTYALAGTSALLGREDFADYALWLDGSPYLFPLLSGAAYLIGGLEGSRILALAFFTFGLWCFARFVRRCFGSSAACWASFFLAINGPFFSLAHLAVYDSLAFAATAACWWSSRELARSPRPKWILRAAVAAALAVTSKYSALVLVAPCLPLALLGARRRSPAATALAVVGAAVMAAAYMSVAHGELIPRLTFEILTSHPQYAERSELAFATACLLVLPLGLAVLGLRHVHASRATLAGCLIVASLVWPALHVAMVEGVGLNKHVAMSSVYLYPLIGVGLSRLWSKRRALALGVSAVAALWGALQVRVQDRSWLDLRPTADFLLPKLGPYDTVGIDTGWDFAMYAVLTGPLQGPSFVMDGWRVRQGDDPCTNDWLIGSRALGLGSAQAEADPTRHDLFAHAAERCAFEEIGRFPATSYHYSPPLVRRSDKELVVYKRKGTL